MAGPQYRICRLFVLCENQRFRTAHECQSPRLFCKYRYVYTKFSVNTAILLSGLITQGDFLSASPAQFHANLRRHINICIKRLQEKEDCHENSMLRGLQHIRSASTVSLSYFVWMDDHRNSTIAILLIMN